MRRSAIGVIWVNHHYLFTRIARVSGALLWRNLALPLAMSVLPFPTAVIASAFQYGGISDDCTAVVLYAVVAGAAAATWLVLFHFLSHAPYRSRRRRRRTGRPFTLCSGS